MKKKFLAFLLAALIAIPAIAATTTHYSYVLPSVGASQNVWGSLLNTIFNTIDSNIWTASSGTTIGVNAPSASGSNITLTNPINSIQNIQFSATGKSLILSAMNATASPVVGGVFYVNNVGSNAFSILAQDGTTSVVAAVPVGQGVAIQLLTNGTANGTFRVTTLINGILPVSGGGTGQSSLTANNVLLGNGTAAVQQVAPGASGNILTSDGSTWNSSAAVGTGTVSSGTTGQIAYYASSGTTVSGTTALPSGTTATTPSAADNTTKVATTAFVNGTALTLTSGTTAATQSASDNSTKVATTAYADGLSGLVKAWVNFNGATGAITSSFNVSSVTLNSMGDFTVNFTNAFVDNNYVMTTGLREASLDNFGASVMQKQGGTLTSSACEVTVKSGNGSNPQTLGAVFLAFYR